jgi:hypothetical protein
MNKFTQVALCVFALTMGAIAWPASPMSSPRVVVLLHWDATTNPAKLLPLIKKGMDVDTKLGCGCNARVWGGAFGGDGGITLVTEFPSLVAMAQYEARRAASAEWAAFITEAMASGTARPSSSIVSEMIP